MEFIFALYALCRKVGDFRRHFGANLQQLANVGIEVVFITAASCAAVIKHGYPQETYLTPSKHQIGKLFKLRRRLAG